MRRFRQGATQRPGLLRPGAGYGRICFGAPGPTREIEPREEIEPDLFESENVDFVEPIRTAFIKSKYFDGDTIIDLTDQ